LTGLVIPSAGIQTYFRWRRMRRIKKRDAVEN
jgi:hypothetical protein